MIQFLNTNWFSYASNAMWLHLAYIVLEAMFNVVTNKGEEELNFS